MSSFAEERIKRLLALLPVAIAAEIFSLSCGQHRFYERLQELRLRAPGRCSLVFGSAQRILRAHIGTEEMQALLLRLCGGSLYAYEECVAEGYLPFEGGIRIGVCGRARYEGERLRGICEIGSLVIRFPHAPIGISAQLTHAFALVKRGMLIYSPPGVGKTTALRMLALALGNGEKPLRVVVIDERMEFFCEEYEDTTVDLLRGYRRPLALEIAHRSMNPEVVMIDEIGGMEEAEAMASLLRGGALVVATAHAEGKEDLYRRGALRPFFEREIFDVLLRLKRESGNVIYTVESAELEEREKQECSAILV